MEELKYREFDNPDMITKWVNERLKEWHIIINIQAISSHLTDNSNSPVKYTVFYYTEKAQYV